MLRSACRLGALAVVGLAVAVAVPATSAGATTSGATGYDVSWPQCGRRLPAAGAFGIVGVNDGLANNTNPCLATELAWAATSRGGTTQPKVSLYINTGNPGLQSTSWPTNDVDPSGTTVSDPYGTCSGADDAACAWMYGWDKAELDFTSRGVASPASYTWWLDVETTNSWESDTGANVADLEAMTTYLRQRGVQVGIYSTAYQWSVIAGSSVSGSSVLDGRPNWLAGARSSTAARTMCADAGFTKGSRVQLVQYPSGSFDGDVACG